MFVFLLLSACLCASVSAQLYAPEEASVHFEEFINKFGKQYADEHEKAVRFEIFKANLETVNRLNSESKHAVFGITQFLDLTPEEFSQMRTGLRTDDDDVDPCPTIVHDADVTDASAPESFDWREHGVVTKVKDQKRCASCYAFSVTGTIEGQNAIKHKTLIEISEQQIVDCDKKSDGCLGGEMSTSLKALTKLGGAMSESDYPYIANKSKCAFDKSKVVVKLGDCISYDLKSQEKVKQVLFKNGPLSIGVRVQAIQSYVNGILHSDICKNGELNHAVLLVGYGTEKNMSYWIVKNSWGAQFGEQGYFRMERSEDVSGACGMLNPYMVTAVVE